ncbi:MAG TPA: hypothetical protein VM431_01355 [Phycisphaerae bacterium]|nr:hypothetical protein [Phycisphaerae bacterium]
MERETLFNPHRWRVRLLAAALALAYLVLGPSVALGAPAGEKPPPAAPAPDAAAPAAGGTATTTSAGEGKIELHVKDDELANVLELLSQQYQLNIIAGKGAKGRVTADLYGVTVEEALDAVCRGSGLVWVREGGCIYVHTPEEIAAIKGDESRLTTEVFSLNYLKGDDAIKLLAPILSAKGSMAVNTAAPEGIPSGGSEGTGSNNFSLQDTVVIRDFPENIERVREVLLQLDRRPRQVLVEATILKITLNDTTSLGVDFNALAGVNFRDLSNTAIPVVDPTSVPNDGLTPVTAPAAMKPWGQMRTEGFAGPGTGLNIGVITNNVAFFIHALEEVTDTVVLSNPKVLALNKQRAEVMVGERLGYKTTTTTETSFIETVEFLDSGTQLLFRPFISDDGYIRLEVHPKVAQGNVINGLPEEITTEVTCNVLVKDGHTIVIGGLFDEDASIGRKQVPGLGNLPGLGWLFRSKEDKTTRHEIIVLLTPHIIEDVEEASKLGEDIRDDIKRRCLGVREGFTFFTRERITVGYVQKANEAWQRYEKGGRRKDLDDAWWNVSLANNVAPNNLKGLRLKDKVLSARNAQPHTPPNLTLWDTIGARLRAMDEAKGAVPGSAKPAPAPKPETATPSAPTATPQANAQPAGPAADRPEVKEVSRAN